MQHVLWKRIVFGFYSHESCLKATYNHIRFLRQQSLLPLPLPLIQLLVFQSCTLSFVLLCVCILFFVSSAHTYIFTPALSHFKSHFTSCVYIPSIPTTRGRTLLCGTAGRKDRRTKTIGKENTLNTTRREAFNVNYQHIPCSSAESVSSNHGESAVCSVLSDSSGLRVIYLYLLSTDCVLLLCTSTSTTTLRSSSVARMDAHLHRMILSPRYFSEHLSTKGRLILFFFN